MNSMKVITSILSAAFFILYSFVPAAAQVWSPQYDQVADTLMAQLGRQTPSATVAITVNGQVVYAKGFGFIALGVHATPQTIYHIGSVSKQFTAAAILALIEDGTTVPTDQSTFGLDSNVSLFFDHVGHWSPTNAPPMTVRRLLNMTSNLPSYNGQDQAGHLLTPPALLPFCHDRCALARFVGGHKALYTRWHPDAV